MTNEINYVYKYVEKGVVKYVGITNNMQKRFYQHTKDKLSMMHNPDVYYFPVKYRGDADMLETYLINYYNTKSYYNAVKTQKGDFSFFDVCDRLPWVLYEGHVNEGLEPFTVSSVIGKKYVEPVEVVKLVDRKSIDGMLWEHRECEKIAEDLIEFERKIIPFLEQLLALKPDSADAISFIKTGLELHQRRLNLAEEFLGTLSLFGCFEHRNSDAILQDIMQVKVQIDLHENSRGKSGNQNS